MKVLIGGGSGFIGRNLTALLRSRGHEVTIISRNAGPDNVTWDHLTTSMRLPECDGLVNLSGEKVLNPLRRFSDSYKRDLLESRSGKNKLLTELIQKSAHPPRVWIASSAVGFYPTEGEFTEDSHFEPPLSWMQSLLVNVEKSSQLLDDLSSVRHAVVRIGVVLGHDGGMLQQSLLPFKLGLGGCIGSGKQWFPWIHIDDISNLFCYVLENDSSNGIFNGVAPEQVTNADYTNCLAGILARPAFCHVPEFAIRAIFSAEEAAMVLEGARILPKRTMASGFQFKFPNLKLALTDITSK